eukprot:TRINITY_DN3332_c0_g1_i2.p1 TRINITY_DN3332_c0_g1~~TRINITY_DN3332_c0_g1_i2.p1  ORF type:complete len:1535 (-),score=318.61 TRINITY_DN3332_c0_g1_i2:98-4702(-)
MSAEKEKQPTSFKHFISSLFSLINIAEEKDVVEEQVRRDESAMMTDDAEETRTIAIKAKHKNQMITVLKNYFYLIESGESIDNGTSSPAMPPLPGQSPGNQRQDPRQAALLILDSVRSLKRTETEEKMDWINRGLLKVLIMLIYSNGDDSAANNTFVQIIHHLIVNNHEASQLFCRYSLEHIRQKQVDAKGLLGALPVLMGTEPFRTIFVQNSGPSVLLELYFSASMKFLGDEVIESIGRIRACEVASTPRGCASSVADLESTLISSQSSTSDLNMLRSEEILTDRVQGPPTLYGTNASAGGRLPLNLANDTKGIRRKSSEVNLKSVTSLKLQSISLREKRQTLQITPSLFPGNTASKPFVPSLSIPRTGKDDGAPSRASRSSRRVVSGRLTSTTRISHDQTTAHNTNQTTEQADEDELPAQEMFKTLAMTLGEAYMAADLTALIAYKAQDMDLSVRKSIKDFGCEAPATVNAQDERDKELMRIRADDNYKIKCHVLHILAILTHFAEMRRQFPNPTNLLFCELAVFHRKDKVRRILSMDEDYKKLIYTVLANYGDEVELTYRHKWEDATKYMTRAEIEHFRRRLDTFLFRLDKRLSYAVDIQDLDQMEMYLTMLVEYMKSCKNRVMSQQVIDVCLESVLGAKAIFCSQVDALKSIKSIKLIHLYLCILNELMLQNHHSCVNELFYALFIERDESLYFLKLYTREVLMNHEFEKKVIQQGTSNNSAASRNNNLINGVLTGEDLMESLRLHLVIHYSRCLNVILKEIKKIIDSNKYGVDYYNMILHPEIVRRWSKLEFLIRPQGYFLTFLKEKHIHPYASVKIEILKFLSKMFSVVGGPFVKKKVYIENYISYHYLSFIKLYHCNKFDQNTLELCKLHLQCLLCFAKFKNEKTVLKFFQMRVMDFLVLLVTLEYDMKLNRNKRHLEPKKKSGGTVGGIGPITLKNSLSKKIIKSVNLPKNAKPVATLKGLKNIEGATSSGSNKESSDSSSEDSSEDEGLGKIPSLNLKGFGLSKMPAVGAGSGKGTPKPEQNKKEKPVEKPKPKITSLALPGVAPKKVDSDTESSSSDDSDDYSDGDKGESSKSEEDKAKKDTDSDSDDSDDSGDSDDSDEDDAVAAKIPNLNLKALSLKPVQKVAAPAKKAKPSKVKSPEIESAASNKPTITSLKIPTSATKGGEGNFSDESKTMSPSLSPRVDSTTSILSPSDHTEDDMEENEQNIQLMYGMEGVQRGFLSTLFEQKINAEDPKPQLFLEGTKIGGVAGEGLKSPDPSRVKSPTLTADEAMIENQFYNREREERKLYHNRGLHVNVLLLIFSLLLRPNHTLEPLYTDSYPLNNKKMNIPFYLSRHINHPANAPIIPELCEKTLLLGETPFRLLKLLCKKLFDPSLYKNLKRIGAGAYGFVYKASLEADDQEVAVKLMDVPKDITDRCTVHDIFSEVLILDKFRSDPRVSHMYDFGVDDEHYWIVMKLYKCSLKSWREKLKDTPFEKNLRLYLNIYEKVLESLRFLREANVNHYDIKYSPGPDIVRIYRLRALS